MSDTIGTRLDIIGCTVQECLNEQNAAKCTDKKWQKFNSCSKKTIFAQIKYISAVYVVPVHPDGPVECPGHLHPLLPRDPRLRHWVVLQDGVLVQLGAVATARDLNEQTLFFFKTQTILSGRNTRKVSPKTLEAGPVSPVGRKGPVCLW